MNFAFEACMVLSFKRSKLSRVAEYVRKDKETVSATVCKIFNSESKEQTVWVYILLYAPASFSNFILL